MSHEMRTARLADAAAIARLHIASWRATYRDDLPATFLAKIDPDERTRVWQGRLADRDYHTRVMVDGEDIVAFCGSGPSADDDVDPATTWEIHNLHVSPTLKRSGLGGRLFDAAADLARAHAAAELTLWVATNNHPARSFYEKKGMQADGAEQTYEFNREATLATVRYRMRLL